LEYYDDWKDHPTFLRDVAEMLDNVLQYFIDNAPDSISRARYSASLERSIGIGALGFHALLQKKNIAWESALAKSLNIRIFKSVRGKLDEANQLLGLERGEAPDAQSLIEFEDSDGNTRSINSSDFVSVIRNGKEISIRACAIVEGDDILSL
jgi:ribonucleoside-diphosphate reductase alpha chain